MTSIRRVGSLFVVIVLLSQWQLASLAHGQTLSFSQAQAAAGRTAYRESCAVCHGAKLEGLQLSPSLVGARFDQTWRGKSAGILSFHLRRMPPESVAEAGSLSDDAYTNILAYILISNGLEAGDDALPSDMKSLGKLKIPQLEGAKYDPDAPVVAAGESELLNSLSAVTDEMLRRPAPSDWLLSGRAYDGLSYSPLTLINRENVGGLAPAWRAPLRPGNSMPTPLVHGGVMFLQTFPDTVLALDASNGKVLWRYQYKSSSGSSQKMGLALHGDKVLVPTSDLHVIALRAKTGE
ncbi:MAG: PQQ-binding-like beta-propeller repeat protein, partial [Proteobacteria bacterium]|nr:PQQ-binding-like beta-propeller repeat protein [Pseudomonadota bacterium]